MHPRSARQVSIRRERLRTLHLLGPFVSELIAHGDSQIHVGIRRLHLEEMRKLFGNEARCRAQCRRVETLHAQRCHMQRIVSPYLLRSKLVALLVGHRQRPARIPVPDVYQHLVVLVHRISIHIALEFRLDRSRYTGRHLGTSAIEKCTLFRS